MERSSQLCLSLEQGARSVDGVPVRTTTTCRLEIAHLLSGTHQEHLKKVVADHALFGRIVEQHGAELVGIVEDALGGRSELARSKAKAIGLSEADFQDQKGGLIGWVIVVVVVAILLYSKDAN